MTDHTVDVTLAGRLRVCQPRAGYRFNLESVALAHRVAALAPAAVVDVGAGSGVIGCGVAVLCPAAVVVMIERDAVMAQCAVATVAANALEARVRLLTADIRDVVAGTVVGDVVVMNPPYYRPGSSRRSPEPTRAAGRQQLYGELEALCSSAAGCVSPAGALVLSYPAEHAVDALTAAHLVGFGQQSARWVHDGPSSDASAMLLTARRGRALRLTVEPPLVLRDRHGRLRAQDELWPHSSQD